MPPLNVILASRWTHYAILALALAGALIWGSAGRSAAEGWKLAHQSQKAATIAAQGEAKAKAIAVRVQNENTFYRLSRKTEESNETIDALERDAAAFATRRSRLCTQVAGGARSGPGTAGEGGPAPLDHGTGQFEVVVLLKPEFDELIDYAKRAEQNRQWGESLILAGLAITEVDFAKGLDPPPVPSE